jgi:hypothetical protein
MYNFGIAIIDVHFIPYSEKFKDKSRYVYQRISILDQKNTGTGTNFKVPISDKVYQCDLSLCLFVLIITKQSDTLLVLSTTVLDKLFSPYIRSCVPARLLSLCLRTISYL